MDTQKRIIVWFSAALIVAISAIGAYQVATGPKVELPKRDGTLSTPVDASDWTKGSKIPKVTFVEYSDFECPACGAYNPLLEEMFAKYKNDMSLTYRHFPLPQHPNALPAAYAAEAAGVQGKFWEMTEMLFENQETWAKEKDASPIFEGYATTLGLDIAKYKADIVSDKTVASVEADMKSGTLSALNHTPTFFINGKMIENPASKEELFAAVDTAMNPTTATTTAK